MIIAEISATDYAVWGECTLPTAKGSQLSTGKLELKEGLATLHFISGAEVILDGAVSIELLSAMSLKLEEGLLVPDIPVSTWIYYCYPEPKRLIMDQVFNQGFEGRRHYCDGCFEEKELVDDVPKESIF